MKRISGFLIDQPIWGVYNRIPIWIYDIIEDHIFPIKFEYKQRGYKGLRFTARKSEIEYIT